MARVWCLVVHVVCLIVTYSVKGISTNVTDADNLEHRQFKADVIEYLKSKAVVKNKIPPSTMSP